jgi:hypothetical protein
MSAAMIEVVIVIAVALSITTVIAPMTVALVMAAVAIEGLTIDVPIAFRARATEIAASIGPGAGAIVREGACAARTGA